MINCEECGEKLGIISRYSHPALGIKFLVCGKCFDKIEIDMERWRTFCFSELFNTKSSKSELQDAWNKNLSNNIPLQKWFSNLWFKISS
jgi:hypothetical protein